MYFLFSGIALAGLQVTDDNGRVTRNIAPDGRQAAKLTIVRTTKSPAAAWTIYSPSACIFKQMTTSTFTTGALSRTIPQNVTITRSVNPSTKFINFSGCTNAEYDQE